MKKCYKCGVEKPPSEFYKNKANKDGLQKRCKPCDVKITKETYQKDPKIAAKKRFVFKLKREYNLTLIQYESLKQNQNNSCAICKTELQAGMQAHIDHCHSTNIVRGILCRWCNIGLGHFKDSIENLKSAQKYLKKYSQ
jgi:hypothetical protein